MINNYRKFKLGDKVIGYFVGIGPVRGTVAFFHLNGSIFIRSEEENHFGISGHPMQIYHLDQEEDWASLGYE